MLTPYVTTLVFTNVMAACALSWAVVLNAAISSGDKNSSRRLLTPDESIRTRFSGRAGGTGRPTAISGSRKEEFYELPSAA